MPIRRYPAMTRCALGVLLAVLCLAPSHGARARDQDARVQELERRLEQRNQVIEELLKRVEALERRVGISSRAADAGGTSAAAGDAGAGPAAGAPGAVVVDAASAERALERSLSQEGALLLPAGTLEIQPGLSYARQEDSAPGIVAAGGGLQVGETVRNADSLTGDLALRLGLPGDAQLEFGVPFRWRGVDAVTRVGFSPTAVTRRDGAAAGDVRLGLAKTLLHEGWRRPDLIGRVTWDTATGARSDNGVGLGGGFNELRGSLTAIKRQDPIAFVGGLSYQHAFESGGLRPGATYGANAGGFLALSPETSLRLFFRWAYQEDTRQNGARIAGSDRTLGTLVVGGSTLLAPGTLLNLSVGVGLTGAADDLSVSLSLPVRLDTSLF